MLFVAVVILYAIFPPKLNTLEKKRKKKNEKNQKKKMQIVKKIKTS